MTKAPN